MPNPEEEKRLVINGLPISHSQAFELEITSRGGVDELYGCETASPRKWGHGAARIRHIDDAEVDGDPVVFGAITEERGRKGDFTPKKIETGQAIGILKPPEDFIVLGVLKAVKMTNLRNGNR